MIWEKFNLPSTPVLEKVHQRATSNNYKKPANMCRYYAHSHVCGHTNTVFAAYCPPAALKQRPCAGGEIWQTLKMDQVCSICGLNGDSEAIINARKAKAAAAAGRR